jgi:predicted peroxiredoxin
MAKLMVNCTHGKDDPERATLPFIIANVAVTADQEVVVLLAIEGVWLATKGYAEGVEKEGFPPLRDVLRSYVANGGQIWACGTCTKPRGITEDRLIDGAKIVNAVSVVEYVASGAQTLSF